MPLSLGNGAVVDVVNPQPPIIRIAPPELTSNIVIPMPGPVGPQGPIGPRNDFVVTRVAATNLSGHRVVTPQPDSTVAYADNSTPDDIHTPLWLTLGAALAGSAVDVLLFGEVTEPSWSWLKGPIYLGESGLLTQTPPSSPNALFITLLGSAISPTSIFFDPQLTITLA